MENILNYLVECEFWEFATIVVAVVAILIIGMFIIDKFLSNLKK